MTSRLNKTRKRKIDEAIEDGTVPYSKRGKVYLQTGPKSVVTLATAQGGSTQNGKYWTENSGQDLPSATANLSQPYVQYGISEFILNCFPEDADIQNWYTASQFCDFFVIWGLPKMTSKVNWNAAPPKRRQTWSTWLLWGSILDSFSILLGSWAVQCNLHRKWVPLASAATRVNGLMGGAQRGYLTKVK